MGKPEVQPLAASVLCGGQIVVFLLGCESVPPLVSLRVPPDIEELDGNDKGNVVGNDSKQNLVANPVVRRVGRVVNLTRRSQYVVSLVRLQELNSHWTKRRCQPGQTCCRGHCQQSESERSQHFATLKPL